MVDNTTITPGAGATIAADDIGAGVLAQRVKPVWGPDGTGNDIDVATGKPLPVQVRSSTGLIPIGEPTDAAATATDITSVSAISLWKQISKSVQLMVFGAGTAAAAQRATLASDDPAVTSLQLIDDTVVAQGTALGTTKNSMVGGSVTTAAPSYTTGQISPLSLDTTGALRVTGSSSATQYTEDAAAAADPVGNMLVAVRRDTLSTSEVSADGDNIALKATNKGKLHVAAELRFADTVSDIGSGTGGSATQRVIIDSSQFSALGATTKSASVSVARATDEVLGLTVTQAASSTITRPADTTGYTSGDLIANSVTAGSVTNLQFTTLARISGGSGVIVGAQIQKSTTNVTNAAVRLHLFNTAPTYTSAGDNTAISTVVVASGKGYLGYIDITSFVAFSDVSVGSGAPDNSRGGIPYVATAQIIYGLLEARNSAAWTIGNAEVFTVTVDALQD